MFGRIIEKEAHQGRVAVTYIHIFGICMRIYFLPRNIDGVFNLQYYTQVMYHVDFHLIYKGQYTIQQTLHIVLYKIRLDSGKFTQHLHQINFFN